MARRRKQSLVDAVYSSLVALFLLYYGGIVAFWRSLTPQSQQIFIILSIAILIVGIALVVVFINYRKHKRQEVWMRAMKSYKHKQQTAPSQGEPVLLTTKYLSPYELEKFAASVYEQMGYKVRHTGRSGDHGVDVYLTAPNGQIEIVQCKQWSKPVGEEAVQKLLGSLKHENAACAYLWAPGGFTAPARQWAKGHPIILADEEEIQRIVESTFSN